MSATLKRIAILVAALLPVVILGSVVMQQSSSTTESVSSVVAVAQQPSSTTNATVTTAPAPSPTTTTPTPTPSTTPTAPVVQPTPAPTAAKSTYTDGTYSVTSAYRVPEAAPQSIGVKVTLKNDIVTDVVLTEMATDETSREYQDVFAAGYKTFAVGMNIADIQLSRVSGASLTSRGFNDALAAIKKSAAV